MNKILKISEFHPFADGRNDDTDTFVKCFESAKKECVKRIIIDSGTYYLSGKKIIPLFSDLEISCEKAKFLLPHSLENATHLNVFFGKNISNFKWHGGEFYGNVYHPDNEQNQSAPNTSTRCIVIETDENGFTANLCFESMYGENVAGAVVSVFGSKSAEDKTESYASDIHLINCTFNKCGKFMWDYGYLWQRITFPELHNEKEVALAYKYMPSKHMSGSVIAKANTDFLIAENITDLEKEKCAITFFGDVMPKPIKRGKKYFIVSTEKNKFFISQQHNGSPILFKTDGGKNLRFFKDSQSAFYGMYAPENSAEGKGSFDFTGCKNVIVNGCILSAVGDTMHIHSSDNVIFSSNEIISSRMGAFFIAEHCSNVTATNNTVKGTNGSRVMSIERSCKNITVSNNIFIGGGRGSWINQPENLILSDNIFIENTTKCEKNPQIGRISCEDGDYEQYSEIYFTTWQENAKYGPVIIKNNIIKTLPHCTSAIHFHGGGRNILLDGNIFQGEHREIIIDKNCDMPDINNNIGITDIITK